MEKEYKTFFKSLLHVLQYGIDVAPTSSAEDQLKRPFSITDQEFLECLYVPRVVEQRIEYLVRTSGNFVCFVGPRGAGKTSVGRRIVNDLRNSLLDRSFVAFLDIRITKKLQQLELNSKDSFQESLRKRLLNEYLSELFPYQAERGADNPKIKLWEYLLRPDNSSLPHELIMSFFDLREEAAQIFAAYQTRSSANAKATYADWLVATHNTTNEVGGITNSVLQRVTIPHLVYAARFVYGYFRQVIWLDNTDALPEGLQPEVINVVKEFHGLISEYASTVIAVREENVFREYDPPSDHELSHTEPGAPPYYTRVKLELPRDENGHAYYPAIDIPVASETVINEMIAKRFTFTRQKQVRNLEELTSKRRFHQDKLSSMVEQEEREKLEKVIEECNDQMEDYSPVLSKAQLNNLESSSAHLLKSLHDHKAIYLANNSLRDFLFIHRDCLAYLIKSTEGEDPSRLPEYEDWYISTLFFSWLGSTERKYRFPLYNVMSALERWYEDPKSTIGCVLAYLVLTTVWNLALEKEETIDGVRQYRSPRVDEVIKRLEDLDFQHDDICDAMYSLYNLDGERGNMLEFRANSLLRNAQQIKGDYLVYLTCRAKSFVAFASNTFGYFFECVRRYKHKGDRSRAHRHSIHIPGTDDVASGLLPYLCDIAEMHYQTLKRFRDAGKLGHDNWLDIYCSRYGIPQEEQYKIGGEVGMITGGIRRPLQLDALINGLLGYIRKGSARSQLEKLQKLYSQSVQQLGGFREDAKSPVDFRAELGLPPRLTKP